MKRLIKQTDVIKSIFEYDDIFEISIPFITKSKRGHIMLGLTKRKVEYSENIEYYLSFWKSERYKNTAKIFEIMQERNLFRLFSKKA